MKLEKKWRFPKCGFGRESGLNEGNMETFKKDPMASLARELCQNTIDARNKNSNFVRLEFKSFSIKRKLIPGIDEVTSMIKKCMDYNSKNPVVKKELENMLKASKEEEIACLRISDFYTTGLVGVSTNTGPYYYLTKGSGMSDKRGTSGGSKGVGKYATFVTSKFNTVFYSTQTENNEAGYIGITELCSAPSEDSDDKTQGTGYYAADEKNCPILESFFLDPNFKRCEGEYGTDIYILGFKNEKNWHKEIISKILESFISAIYYETLEISVDDIEINKSTLRKVIDADLITTSKLSKSIKSQYILLSEPSFKDVLTISEYGDVILSIKQFKKEEKDLATNNTIMIRYPYMKIKELKSGAIVPFSAMCLINENQLNEVLRGIENPQHTDWEINRIDDIDEKNEVRSIIKELNDKIEATISERLRTTENKSADVYGADSLLPDSGEDENEEDINSGVKETPIISKSIRSKPKFNLGDVEDGAESESHSIGEYGDDDGDEASRPDGHNRGKGSDVHPSEENTSVKDGENIIMKKVNLTGIKYRFIVLDKNVGKYLITFRSPYNYSDLELKLFFIDDNNAKEEVNLIEATVNDVKYIAKNNSINGFAIKKDQLMKICVVTDQKELFASEVKLYASE